MMSCKESNLCWISVEKVYYRKRRILIFVGSFPPFMMLSNIGSVFSKSGICRVSRSAGQFRRCGDL